MVTETYGDVLYSSGPDTTMIDFPSPEFLKKRIVVSTKPPKEYLDTSKSMKENVETSVKTKTSSEEDVWGVELSDPLKKQKSFDEVGNHSHSLHQINKFYLFVGVFLAENHPCCILNMNFYRIRRMKIFNMKKRR